MSDVYRRLQSNRVEYKLSVLILSLPNRLEKLSSLLSSLNKQCIRKPVQVLYLGDNKSMTVGEKRNQILSIAKGRYISFVDDDDTISDDYVQKILDAIEDNPQVITFKVQQYRNGIKGKYQKYYLNNGPIRNHPDMTHKKMAPDHLCVWRKDIIKESFPHKNVSEDHVWAQNMQTHYSSIHEIDQILYSYHYFKETSETH